jgi:hypothetical protein
MRCMWLTLLLGTIICGFAVSTPVLAQTNSCFDPNCTLTNGTTIGCVAIMESVSVVAHAAVAQPEQLRAASLVAPWVWRVPTPTRASVAAALPELRAVMESALIFRMIQIIVATAACNAVLRQTAPHFACRHPNLLPAVLGVMPASPSAATTASTSRTILTTAGSATTSATELRTTESIHAPTDNADLTVMKASPPAGEAAWILRPIATIVGRAVTNVRRIKPAPREFASASRGAVRARSIAAEVSASRARPDRSPPPVPPTAPSASPGRLRARRGASSARKHRPAVSSSSGVPPAPHHVLLAPFPQTQAASPARPARLPPLRSRVPDPVLLEPYSVEARTSRAYARRLIVISQISGAA